jgi:hypothetical protein
MKFLLIVRQIKTKSRECLEKLRSSKLKDQNKRIQHLHNQEKSRWYLALFPPGQRKEICLNNRTKCTPQFRFSVHVKNMTILSWLQQVHLNTIFMWFIPVVCAITSTTNDIHNASKNTTICYVLSVRYCCGSIATFPNCSKPTWMEPFKIDKKIYIIKQTKRLPHRLQQEYSYTVTPYTYR